MLDKEKSSQGKEVALLPQDLLAPGEAAQLKADYQKRVKDITPENLHIANLQVDEIDYEQLQ